MAKYSNYPLAQQISSETEKPYLYNSFQYNQYLLASFVAISFYERQSGELNAFITWFLVSTPISSEFTSMTDMLKVHLGCGPKVMPGWVNVDYNPDFNPEIVADLTETFPFAAETVDFIHTEGCLCQFDLEAGCHFLTECFRILKPGAVMRLLTPDLEKLLRTYLDNKQGLVDLWNNEVRIPLRTNSACEVLNTGIRSLHNYMYDCETLTALLLERGFKVRQCSYDDSEFEALQGLDERTPENATYMYFECTKPPVGL